MPALSVMKVNFLPPSCVTSLAPGADLTVNPDAARHNGAVAALQDG